VVWLLVFTPLRVVRALTGSDPLARTFDRNARATCQTPRAGGSGPLRPPFLMRISGSARFYHDSAAVLLEDGRIVAAAQEERFFADQARRLLSAPRRRLCLTQAHGPLDAVVYYEKPLLKFERIPPRPSPWPRAASAPSPPPCPTGLTTSSGCLA